MLYYLQMSIWINANKIRNHTLNFSLAYDARELTKYFTVIGMRYVTRPAEIMARMNTFDVYISYP